LLRDNLIIALRAIRAGTSPAPTQKHSKLSFQCIKNPANNFSD
jgi:hypothetical protein